MKLFGRKRLSVDEILEGIEALSDEEKRRLEWALGGADEDGEKPAAEEAKASEVPEENAEGEKAEIAEAGTEEAKPSAAPAEAGGEIEVEAPATDSGDAVAALRSEITELKGTLEALAARITASEENKPQRSGEAFGLAADESGHAARAESELEKAKAKYWNL